MPLVRLADSVLLLVDFQPKFMATMPDRDQVIRRAKLLASGAALLGVPIFVTEQNLERMGGTYPELVKDFPEGTKMFDKMAFSAMRAPRLSSALQALGRSQVVLAGIETHICVNQSAHDLLHAGYEVHLAADAITGRGEQARAHAFKRMKEAGATLSNTESILYEWMGSAEHPYFRDVLKLVKDAS